MTLLILNLTVIALAETLQPTKRNILRIIAMFYDAIGIISPITLQVRLLFYKICVNKYDSDTELPPNCVLLNLFHTYEANADESKVSMCRTINFVVMQTQTKAVHT